MAFKKRFVLLLFTCTSSFGKYAWVFLLLLSFQVIAQKAFSPSACYYTLNLRGFEPFLNGVWRDVYQWDSGREAFDRSGKTIGGWKSIQKDNLEFEHYTEYGGSWEGFCVSNRHFAYQRPDPLNQFTATTLGGKDGQGTPYLIAYYGIDTKKPNNCRITLKDGVACEVPGMYVTNTYYNYLSLLSGDGFARCFAKGDWFLLTAYGYDQSGSYTGTAEFYLADYRSENPSEHYIVQDWRWFDLSALGAVTSLEFALTSSDNAEYGMNTPSYFCMDKLTLSLLSVKQSPETRTVCLGDSVAFSVNVKGNDFYDPKRKTSSPRLQWRKNGVDIPSAHDSLLKIFEASKNDTGAYTCYAISDYHTQLYRTLYKDPTFKAEVMTSPAHFTVLPPPRVLVLPVSSTIEEGESTSFKLEVEGDSLLFAWYKNNKLLETSSPTLLLENTSLSDSGFYHYQVIGACGANLRDSVKLKVTPKEGFFQQGIYPNPCVKGERLAFSKLAGYALTIKDLNGRLVEAFAPSSDYETYSTEYLPSGAYLITALHPEKGKKVLMQLIQ